MEGEVGFSPANKHGSFLQDDSITLGFFKLLLSFSGGVARHAQITQNNKFAIFLQYLKKELSDDVDFLHADKHESLLQIDSMFLMGNGQAFPKFPK